MEQHEDLLDLIGDIGSIISSTPPQEIIERQAYLIKSRSNGVIHASVTKNVSDSGVISISLRIAVRPENEDGCSSSSIPIVR